MRETVRYRKLGKWGVRVSEVGLGSWLTYGGSVDEKSAIEQIHHAYSLGINFFDTANVYHQGAAESIVGKALAAFKRESYILATKAYFPIGEGPNDSGLSRKHLVGECHKSLKRLCCDYIDLYQCHRFDADTPIEEVVVTMNDLRAAGKILYWGVSEWPAACIVEAVETAKAMNMAPPVSNQPLYNMLSRQIEDEVLPVCEEAGLGQVVFSPLAQGVLTGKYRPGQALPSGSRAADASANIFMFDRGLMSEETLTRVKNLGAVAADLGITMAQLGLAWCLRLPSISSVIVGATKVGQIDDNAGASGITLSDQILERIEGILTERSAGISV